MGVIYRNRVNENYGNRTFTTNQKSCKLSVDDFDNLHASGNSNYSIEKATLCAIGEFVERETMFENAFDYKHGVKDSNTLGYSIARNCVVDLEMDFSENFDKYFQDSCAMASHTSSEDCLLNALCEYVERQSFLFSYLSKTPALFIDFGIKNDFHDTFALFPDSQLKFYQISLSEVVKVVFAKAYYKGKVMIGLGSSTNIKDAMDKCIKELHQCKEVYDLAGDKRVDIKGLKYGEYGKVFFSLDPKRIWNAYEYLDSTNKSVLYLDHEQTPVSIKKFCVELYEKYKMDPIIVYLNRRRNCSTHKVIKILDTKWFNSLLVKNYSPDLFVFVESVTGRQLDKKCTFIPFP